MVTKFALSVIFGVTASGPDTCAAGIEVKGHNTSVTVLPTPPAFTKNPFAECSRYTVPVMEAPPDNRSDALLMTKKLPGPVVQFRLGLEFGKIAQAEIDGALLADRAAAEDIVLEEGKSEEAAILLKQRR